MAVGAHPIAVNVNTGVLSYESSASGTRPSAADQGLVGWAFDSGNIASNTDAYTAGILYLVRVVPAVDATVAQLGISLFAGGVTLANCFLGLYSAAGTLLSDLTEVDDANEPAKQLAASTAAHAPQPAVPPPAPRSPTIAQLLRENSTATATDAAFSRLFTLWGAVYAPGEVDPCLQAV